MTQDQDPLSEVAAMTVEELRTHLSLAERHLDAIEGELEELQALRDIAIIRLAAMRARLVALEEAGGDQASKSEDEEALGTREGRTA